MLKRILLIALCLLMPLSAWAATPTDIPLPTEEADDGLLPMTDEAMLDMMAQLPEAGHEDNSGFLVLPEDIDMPEENVYNILLIGTDSYSEDTRGRSDTTVYVRLDAGRKTIRMVSFLRDMYVKIPGRGSNRINASYAWGGATLLEKTLESNFGIAADAYVEVNFERLVGVIDAIGGVDVEVTEKEREQVNSILRFYNTHTGDPEEDQLLEDSGMQLLTGKQALCFSRIRKIDSDFQRTSRQRQVIEAAFHKVMTLDMASLTALVMQNLDAVNTDLALTDAIRLIPLALRCKNAAFESIHIPAEGAYSSEFVNGMAVLVPNLKKNKNILNNFLDE